jgi:paraquat-inducible protein B
MGIDNITMKVKLPSNIFEQLRYIAHQQQRSVNDIARDLIANALSELPQDVKDEIKTFANLSDDVLWLLARSTLPQSQQKELAQLNEEAQRRSLTQTEEQRQQTLLNQYDRVIVRRAEAARLLKARGYDLSDPAGLHSA